MVCLGILIRDVKHLEKESQVLDVVGVLVVVDVEPVHGMGLWVLVSNNTGVVSGWDQDRGSIGSGTFRRDQTEVVVSIHILFLQLIEVLDSSKAELLQVLLDIIGGKVRDETWFRLAVNVQRNKVVRLSQHLVQAKRELWTIGGEGTKPCASARNSCGAVETRG